MPGSEDFNVNIKVDGEITVLTVPNSSGTILTYNQSTKKISQRTPQQIISDLKLFHSEATIDYPYDINTVLNVGESNWARRKLISRGWNDTYYDYVEFNVPGFGNNTMSFIISAKDKAFINGFEVYHKGNLNMGNYIEAWENAKSIGFVSGDSTKAPYVYHNNGTYIHLASQSWTSQNFAVRDGSNATNTWINQSYALSENPTIPGKTMNSTGTVSLLNSTYGNGLGYINTVGKSNGNPTDDWWYRIKMLHNNAAGYYAEIGVQMTGAGQSMAYKKLENGTLVDWIYLWDQKNLTPTSIANFNTGYNKRLVNVEFINNSEGDNHKFVAGDGTSFTVRKIGLGVVDTRNTGNGLGSNGTINYMPNGLIPALNHKVTPLFHGFSKYGGDWGSSLIIKGWNNNYQAWKITGGATSSDVEREFYLSQTRSSDGNWGPDRQIWTDKHFTQAQIDSWGSIEPSEYRIPNNVDSVQIDDANASIHVIGEGVKQVVIINNIYPKQRFRIYNFDSQGYPLNVRVNGVHLIDVIQSHYQSLWVTQDLRIIREGPQVECEFIL